MYIDSIMKGTDALLIPALIRFYTKNEQPDILDATYGKGRFWIKSHFEKLIGIDIDPALEQGKRYDGKLLIMDNTNTTFNPASFDIVIYDPPHFKRKLTVNDKRKSVLCYYNLQTAPSSHLPFLLEALRLLRPGGLLIAKIADELKSLPWNHITFLNQAVEAGFTPFDFVTKHRQPSIRNPAQQQWRARKCHCFYIVVKKRG